ncbi:hypothetical protein [Butyrivibrio sp. MC2013]|uniref:hypothetical protein n=1 Tax=Butyrivibrio sp. MC2013 TaxID=1280686 RepID=UPI00047CA5EC|nr:hypothetical protein [Butyrivibrio sp. MC2013]
MTKRILLKLMMTATILASVIYGNALSAEAQTLVPIDHNKRIVDQGYLYGEIPYTVYEREAGDYSTNIVASKYYEVMVAFPYGTIPPSTWNITVSVSGVVYSGTLRLQLSIDKPWESKVEAYYSGYIFANL